MTIESKSIKSDGTDFMPAPTKQSTAEQAPPPQYYSPAAICESKPESSEREVCRALIEGYDLENAALRHPFTYYSREADLNGDRKNEIFIWMPILDLGGTSGYPIALYEANPGRFRRVMLVDSWTPIIVLNSESRGWRDVAVQVSGGGVDPHYLIFRYNGREYSEYSRRKKRPKGKVVIEKDWGQSVFGPIPNQR
jgi:hypothetical protein